MFSQDDHRHLRNTPPTPQTANPPDAQMGKCRISDEWSWFYFSSGMLHPVPDDGVDAQHLAAFTPDGAARGAMLRINSQGMGITDLMTAMRVAKEAEAFYEAVRMEDIPEV